MRLAGLLDDLRPGSESNGPPPVLQTKDETLTSSPPNTTRAGTMREILDLLSINNDQLIGDLAGFWREVSLVVGAQPEQGLIDSARAVLDLLSNWDEDFLSENGAELADAAYTGSVRTQGSSTTVSLSMPLVRYAALTFSINSRHREMNTSRRADDDA